MSKIRSIAELDTVLNILCKWRAHFAGWQLGTRFRDDPECQAVRDHREVTLLLRAEVSALVNLLVEKKVITRQEWINSLHDEAVKLDKDYQARWPGAKATIIGMHYDSDVVKSWMKNWKP